MSDQDGVSVCTRFNRWISSICLLFGDAKDWITKDILGLKSPDPEIAYDLSALAKKAVNLRRSALKRSGYTIDPSIAHGSMGLAFSGGGIRSATISLGAAQALAKQNRLLDFDYLSTVSGGGYFGSFLTSLFIPDAARGVEGRPNSLEGRQELKAKREQAVAALSLDAKNVNLVDRKGDPNVTRNPIWWLREHGRYLAPNGPTDYATAAAYMVRNWLAMIYVFLLPVLCAAIGAAFVRGWLAKHFDSLMSVLYFPPQIPEPACGRCAPATPDVPLGFYLSPAVFALGVLIFISLAAGLAYWLTEKPPLTGSKGHKASAFSLARSKLIMVGNVLLTLIVAIATAWWSNLSFGTLFDQQTPLFDKFLAGCVLLVFLAVFISILAGLVERHSSGSSFTTDVRRRLTSWTSSVNLWALVLLAAAIIDTLALNSYNQLVKWFEDGHFFTSIASGLLVPVGAVLINKLPGWFGEGQGRISKWIGSHIGVIALIAAIFLYGSLCVLADIAVLTLTWNGALLPLPGPGQPEIEWDQLKLLGGIITLLLFVTGTFTGFINLSSLHNLYASRLTRAYLGGSNYDRLVMPRDTEGRKTVQENAPKDDIDIAVYQQQPSAAPIHLINVTLNETRNRDGSQLVERDRKGLPVVFAPEGILIDAARSQFASKPCSQYYYPWTTVRTHKVEALSVGQLCAISGAAASSGMGALTTLGGALALTFANIRLGYWWNVATLIRRAPNIAISFRHWVWIRVTRPLRTYFYLFNEMTARYSRDYARLNISDGGHFENSGVYELLRRKVSKIVVCDNGADPDFAFRDLENLVRKARIDLGLSIVVATPTQVARKFGRGARNLFFNGVSVDWRDLLKAKPSEDPSDPARKDMESTFALYLLGYANAPGQKPFVQHHIIWLKPRSFAELPQDVIGYALRNPAFPHETTGDQFFNEAQWESYRALGFGMITTLMGYATHRADCFRRL